MSARTFFVWCALIVALGGAFRLYRLGERSLWLDEASMANHARQPISDMIAKTRVAGSAPVVYPLLLNVVQRVDRSSLAVRLLSAAASLAALATLLALPLAGAGRETALIAGAILAVSPSQIRYAQEVREYSLSVLVAAMMVFALTGCVAGRRRCGVLLIVVLLVAPLVQYGLVFAAAALVVVVIWGMWRAEGPRSALRLAVAGVSALAVGSVVTFVLTLRGQWRLTDAWYLRSRFFGGSILDLRAVLVFLADGTRHLVAYLTLDRGAIILAVPAAALLLTVKRSDRMVSRSLLSLAALELAGTAAAALAHLYPFGPIRQNLFLAPAVAAALGAGWEAFAGRMSDRIRGPATAAFAVSVLVVGVTAAVRADPYREVEDIRSVIAGLEVRKSDETVYVYYGAWPALRFEGVGGPGFVYGTSHRDDPGAYAQEFSTLVGPDRSPVWLVFSHVYGGEDKRLLSDLGSDWRFETVVSATGASLVRACRSNLAPHPSHRE